jgi:hypothetical protein
VARIHVVRPTALIYTEGLHDSIFIGHLKTIYQSRFDEATPVITVKKGRGGTQDAIVKDAHLAPGAFDAKFVKLDSDRPAKEMLRADQLATKLNVTIVRSSPCLEAMLLNILDPGTDYTQMSAKSCKRTFERMYIPSQHRGSVSRYRTIFGKSALDAARARVPDLNLIVEIFEADPPSPPRALL